MSVDPRYDVRVTVRVQYLPEQSDVAHRRYAFAYHITIRNAGTLSAQLLSRHWIVTNGNQQVQEVIGDGVVGKQPHLAPGAVHEYTSGTVLDTPVGTMHGTYQMVSEDGTRFEAPIPAFTLAGPRTLH